MRAVRGSRSCAQLSRRLGYQSNAVSDWEAGRRAPTAARFIEACQALGYDTEAAFRRFHGPSAYLVSVNEGGVAARLPPWLAALRGTTSIALVAQRTRRSRFAVSRWIRGHTEPRLPEFLALVEALTFRAADFADCLVGVEHLPTLAREQHRRRSARELAFEHPDSELVLRVMETQAYRRLGRHVPGVIADSSGITLDRERAVLAALTEAGILQMSQQRYLPDDPLTVDTSGAPGRINRLKAHWAEVACQRANSPRPEDWIGYNLMSLSESDLDTAREMLRRVYREIRALAAASEPVEVAALLNVHLVTFPPISSRGLA